MPKYYPAWTGAREISTLSGAIELVKVASWWTTCCGVKWSSSAVSGATQSDYKNSNIHFKNQ